jgi:hypothetical protein
MQPSTKEPTATHEPFHAGTWKSMANKRLSQATAKTNKYTTSQEHEPKAHQCKNEKTMQKTMHVQANSPPR